MNFIASTGAETNYSAYVGAAYIAAAVILVSIAIITKRQQKKASRQVESLKQSRVKKS